jgi:hypothetical protein
MSLKFLRASRAAEVIGCAVMFDRRFSLCGVNHHPADRVFSEAGCRGHGSWRLGQSCIATRVIAKLLAILPLKISKIRHQHREIHINRRMSSSLYGVVYLTCGGTCRKMTQMEVAYRYANAPTETAMRAIDNMREVYGIRRVRFNEKEQTVRIEYDASRFKEPVVANLLRKAGVEVTEKLVLA